MLKRWLKVGTMIAAAGWCAGVATAQNSTNSQNTGNWQATSGQNTSFGNSSTFTAPTLKVGDKAPALSVQNWLKGQPVTSFEPGKTYVVEFWATWCHPCRDVIPHLTDLQTLFKDKGVTVVGISTNEQNGLEDLSPFIEKMGSKMGYTVGFDGTGATENAWMRASGNTPIPTAFIVNKDGRIAWIGHPTHPKGQMDQVLAQVVDGTFDLSAAAAKEAQALQIQNRAHQAWNSGNHAEALNILMDLVDLDPAKYSTAALQRFQGLLLYTRDYVGAYAWADAMIEGYYNDDPDVLTEIAWTIVQAPNLENRDLNVALRACERAEQLTGGVQCSVLDTKARVHFMRGELAQAVQLQQRAVELVADETMKPELELRLDEYQRAVASAEK
jgi:thiol-disulfide isomerase/thioredoxin